MSYSLELKRVPVDIALPHCNFIGQSEERLAAAQGGVPVASVHSATHPLRHDEVGCQGDAKEEGQVKEE